MDGRSLMIINKKMLFNNWIIILSLMIGGYIIVGAVIVYAGNLLTNNTIDAFYDYNISEKKNDLEIEVNNRLDEIDYERSNIVKEENAVIKSKIDEAYHNLLDNKDKLNSDKEIIKQFEQFVKYDDYLYFAINRKGELLRSGTDESLVGINMIDAQDKNGNYFIKNMLEAINNKDGVYVEYYWPKTKDGEPLEKNSYCKYLPEFDIIIGTGYYYDDVTSKLKEMIYKRLQSYYEDKENYIFVHDYDSTALVTGRRELIGVKAIDLVDYNGESVHNKIMSIINSDGKGFIQYKYIDKDSNKLSEKISYVATLDGWNAYIGTGFYLDDLATELHQFNNNYRTFFYNEALMVIVGLIMLSLIIFVYIQRGAYMQKKYLEQDDIVFEKLFEISGQAIAVLSSDGELIYQNDKSYQIFEDNLTMFINEEKFDLPSVSEDTYEINYNEKTHYIKYKCERASFKGYDSSIYIFDDVTEEYLNSHHLLSIAKTDALTKLPNRHALIEDFSLFKSASDIKCVIGILDIDHFKSVNDNYGHKIGDEVLITIAEVFSRRLRHTDNIYRYGGEEFVVIMHDITVNTAKKIITEINESFSDEVKLRFGFTKTFSCGLIEINYFENKTLDYYVDEADKLLYLAKEKGRNRIEIKT